MTCCQDLTPEELAALKARIAKLEEVYDTLMAGGSVASFTDQNGERVEYRAANRTALFAYINTLRIRAGMPVLCGVVGRPIGFIL